MRRTSRSFVAAASFVLVLSAIACAPAYYSDAQASTYLGFRVDVGNAPPPPRLYFRSGPQYRVTVSSGVRVIDSPDPNCDLFLYSGNYYLYSGGYWYRCREYGGDYTLVEVYQVPRPVLQVPEKHWHHHPGRGQGNAYGHEKHGHGKGDDDRQ